MIRNLFTVLSGFVFLVSCADADNVYELDSIYKYCRADFKKSGIIKKLGFEEGEFQKYYRLKDKQKLRFASVILNPQDERSIQTIVIKWPKKPGLTSKDIMGKINFNFPIENNVTKIDRNSKTIYRFKGPFENVMDTELECEKDNLNRCWSIKFTCSEFVHD